MAAVRLQIEVDADVQPELYVALAALSRPASRSERLRQLAASGLIWEHLRLSQSPPAQRLPGAPDVAQTQRDTAPGEVPVLWDVIDAASMASARQAATASARPASPVASARAEAVDALAQARDSAEDVESDAERRSRPVLPVARPTAVNADVAAFEEQGPTTSAPVVLVAAARPARARSRLLRMREKGLFRNGPDG